MTINKLKNAILFTLFFSLPIAVYAQIDDSNLTKNDIKSNQKRSIKLTKEDLKTLINEGAISEVEGQKIINQIQNIGESPSTYSIPKKQEIKHSIKKKLALQYEYINDVTLLKVNNIGKIKNKKINKTKSGWRIIFILSKPNNLKNDISTVKLKNNSYVTMNLKDNNLIFNIDHIGKSKIKEPSISLEDNDITIKIKHQKSTVKENRINDFRFPSFLRINKNKNKRNVSNKRAIAPPLGDIAVGSIVLKNRGFIELEGPEVTLKLNGAPAISSLMELVELGGYGFVYVDESNSQVKQRNKTSNIPNITLTFKKETYSKAINTILLASGLQAKKDGNLLIVGKNVLGKSFGPQLSKVYRLNQASSDSAADYLASLGAQINKVNVISSSSSNNSGGGSSSKKFTDSVTLIDTYSAASGPLKGLIGTTDSRLQTITLIGSSNLIGIAEKYLKQLDLRQRQVALSVKILDVDLSNTDDMQNDLAIRMGSTFIVSNNGELRSVFGAYLPSNVNSDLAPITTTKSSTQDLDNQSSSSDQNSNNYNEITSNTLSNTNNSGTNFKNDIKSDAGSNSNTNTSALVTSDQNDSSNSNQNQNQNDTQSSTNSKQALNNTARVNETQQSTLNPNPGLNYPNKELYTYLIAKIRSSSTKILANPTLILSENSESIRGGAEAAADAGLTGGATIGRPFANESFISVGKQVITDFKITQSSDNGPIGCEPSFETSGLTFGARVNKIDDNGYVTFSLSPKLTAVTEKFPIPNCGSINILNVRRLDTGTLRVRDSQTLILTGVISDFDSEVVNKWPLLGDMPIVGRLFRSTSGEKRKSELVIMVTPKIINDSNSSLYGLGFTPKSKTAKDLMREQKLN